MAMERDLRLCHIKSRDDVANTELSLLYLGTAELSCIARIFPITNPAGPESRLSS